MKIGHAIANFFSGLWKADLQPWLKDLLTHVEHDVVASLVPIAHEAIQEVINEGGQLLAGADIKSVAANAGAVLMRVAQKAEHASIQAAGHDLLTAVAGAIATRNAQDAAKPAG